MRLLSIVLSLLASFVVAEQLSAQQPPKGPAAGEAVPGPATLNPSFKSFKEQSSYAIGMDIARGIKMQGLEVDPTAMVKGISDALGGGKALLTDKEFQATMVQLQKEAVARAQEVFTKMAEKNKKEGTAFLAENKKKEGVKTTASGLQYKVLKQGTGATPKATDLVTTNYRGTFLDGTEFDSSYRSNEPAKFLCNRVIPGWTEALQLMRVGDKWQLFVPSELAYRETGFGNDIPPNATLIFEIELLDTKPAPAPAKGTKATDSLPGPNE